jgi:hypothetical protein
VVRTHSGAHASALVSTASCPTHSGLLSATCHAAWCAAVRGTHFGTASRSSCATSASPRALRMIPPQSGGSRSLSSCSHRSPLRLPTLRSSPTTGACLERLRLAARLPISSGAYTSARDVCHGVELHAEPPTWATSTLVSGVSAGQCARNYKLNAVCPNWMPCAHQSCTGSATAAPMASARRTPPLLKRRTEGRAQVQVRW